MCLSAGVGGILAAGLCAVAEAGEAIKWLSC